MTDAKDNTEQKSPFHPGEHALQEKMGVRAQMERFGRRVIRDHLPDQHRAFYQQLPYIFVGHADKNGWPWASMLFNQPGFMSSPDAKILEINTLPVKGDPLNDALNIGTSLGLMGVELSTRRRNRLAAHITGVTSQGISLKVDQSFGNCPQYIQRRELQPDVSDNSPAASVKTFTTFDAQALALIAASDTFMVASYIDNSTGAASEGVDVSHRGGKPGFIRIDNNTLTIPDYVGNFHFNTLGNFIKNPKAGLLFIDFENGHMLTLTGRVKILWDSPDTEYFSGAERLWTFELEQGHWLKNSMDLRWQLTEYSANTQMTGTWQEAKDLAIAHNQKNLWLPYKITDIVTESSVVKSFYLQAHGHQRPQFEPGQFLTIKLAVNGRDQIRTYTVSSGPGDEHLRLSIKRESANNKGEKDGVVSSFFHDQLKIGDTLVAKAPCGAFTFDAGETRPAVLLAGGIGITPMVSMVRHVLAEGIRTRSMRPVTVISASRTIEQRAFFEELNQLAAQSSGYIQAFWLLSQVDKTLKAGKDFHQSGRISADFLQAVLPLDDYDFYLCGPAGFMQDSYDLLINLGVNDHRIYAEEFGPASLTRRLSASEKSASTMSVQGTSSDRQLPAAQEAIVEFSQSGVEQAWSEQDGSLLDFAEAHGFTPEYGCRSGQCGACKARVVKGQVSYLSEYSATVEPGEILLCCAVPAAVEGQELSKITLEL